MDTFFFGTETPVYFSFFLDPEWGSLNLHSRGRLYENMHIERVGTFFQLDFEKSLFSRRERLIAKPDVKMDNDQDKRDNHDQHRFRRIADVSQIIPENVTLGSKGETKAIFIQAKFKQMGLYLVFDLSDSFLIGGQAKDKEHEKSS